MNSIFILLFLASLVLLILGFFSPKSSLFWYKQERTRKKSATIYGIATITFIILGSATSDKQPSTKSNIKDTTAISQDKESKTDENQPTEETKKTYSKIGDEVTVGNFVYRVNGIKFTKTIGKDFVSKTADGIFLVVDLSLKNLDKEAHTLDNSLFKLTAESGNQYESSTEGTTALEMSGIATLFLKQCNPSISKQGMLVFEVPQKDIYDLHLSGGFWNGKTAIVKLTDK